MWQKKIGKRIITWNENWNNKTPKTIERNFRIGKWKEKRNNWITTTVVWNSTTPAKPKLSCWAIHKHKKHDEVKKKQKQFSDQSIVELKQNRKIRGN